jgi:hypothetical protein
MRIRLRLQQEKRRGFLRLRLRNTDVNDTHFKPKIKQSNLIWKTILYKPKFRAAYIAIFSDVAVTKFNVPFQRILGMKVSLNEFEKCCVIVSWFNDYRY